MINGNCATRGGPLRSGLWVVERGALRADLLACGELVTVKSVGKRTYELGQAARERLSGPCTLGSDAE